MNYPIYGTSSNYYMQDLQNMRDRIDSQMKQMQQIQNQNQQPQIPQVNQTFQLAPNTINTELDSKYANNIDEVRNTFVMKTGIFITKDFSTLWIKDVSGNIRTFKTEEIIEMDEKDKEIYELKKEIEKMKGMIANESVNTNVDEQITKTKSSRVSNDRTGNAK